jgi:hypothetical protein
MDDPRVIIRTLEFYAVPGSLSLIVAAYCALKAFNDFRSRRFAVGAWGAISALLAGLFIFGILVTASGYY